MEIKATTTPTGFDGEFMFLQLAEPHRRGRDSNGVFFSQPATGGIAIDNSFPGAGGSYGYPLRRPDSGVGWFLYAGETIDKRMGNSPFVKACPVTSSIQAGTNTPRVNEKFDTYVMYRAAYGVWIAIGKVHWESAGGAVNDPVQGWRFEPVGAPPPPSATAPLAGAEWFPAWSDRSTRILAAGWQPMP